MTSEEDVVLSFPQGLHRKLPALKRLEDQFRCRICYDLLTEPTSTSCGHTFCSLCIRKFLNYKMQCPECYYSIRDSELRPNRVLKEVLRLLATELLPEIKIAANAGSIVFKKLQESQPPFKKAAASSPSPSQQDKQKPPLAVHCSRSVEDLATRNSTTPEASTSKGEPESRIAVSASQTKPAQERVDCPVCKVLVPKANINLHLDRCLKGEVSKPIYVTSGPQHGMKPLQKVVYHLLKDSDLRKIVKEAGLDTKGSKATLEKRHKRFAAIWNTECQKDRPMSKIEIAMRARKEEQEERKAEKESSSHVAPIFRTKANTNPQEIEVKAKEYIQQNKSSFQDLIKQIRSRDEKKPAQTNDLEKKGTSDNSRSETTIIAAQPTLADFECSNIRCSDDDPSKTEVKATPPSRAVADDQLESQAGCQSSDKVPSENSALADERLSQSTEDCNISDVSVINSSLITAVDLKCSIRTPGCSSTPRRKAKPGRGLASQAELYITPKRKSFDDMREESKRLRQDSIEQSLSNRHKASDDGALSKRDLCPICQKDLPTKYLETHANTCLNLSERASQRETRSKAAKRAHRPKAKAGLLADDDDYGDFEEDEQEFDPERGLPAEEMEAITSRTLRQRHSKRVATLAIGQEANFECENTSEVDSEVVEAECITHLKSDDMMPRENENFDTNSLSQSSCPGSPLKALSACASPKERAVVKGKRIPFGGRGGKRSKVSRRLAERQD